MQFPSYETKTEEHLHFILFQTLYFIEIIIMRIKDALNSKSDFVCRKKED